MHPVLLEQTQAFNKSWIKQKKNPYTIYLENMWNRNTSKAKEYETFISAPFGNWIKHKNAISVTGTWTLEPRGNVLWSVVKSLRWNSDLQGWTNNM